MSEADSRSFRRAVARHSETDPEDLEDVVTFDLTTTKEFPVYEDGEPVFDEDGEQVYEERVVRQDFFTAHKPKMETLILAAARGGRVGTNPAEQLAAVLSLFRAALPEVQMGIIYDRLEDPQDEVGLYMLLEVFEWLQEQWQSFPTPPSSASSAQPRPTGGRSTGRSPGRGSTRSQTGSTAS
jgi:hypothetical protein